MYISTKKLDIFSPFRGQFIDLSNVPDPVFAEKMVGDGFAIDPFENTLYSPVDGKIKSVHTAKHAITIETEIGIDMLIHIGLETVSLNGEGFTIHVSEGDIANMKEIYSV